MKEPEDRKDWNMLFYGLDTTFTIIISGDMWSSVF